MRLLIILSLFSPAVAWPCIDVASRYTCTNLNTKRTFNLELEKTAVGSFHNYKASSPEISFNVINNKQEIKTNKLDGEVNLAYCNFFGKLVVEQNFNINLSHVSLSLNTKLKSSGKNLKISQSVASSILGQAQPVRFNSWSCTSL